MKKYLIIASAALVALAACTKEQDLREPSPIKEGAVLTFTSQRPQMTPDTKTAWNSTTSSIDWTSGDKISVGYTLGGNWMAQSSAADLNADPKVSPKFYASNQVAIDAEDPSIGTFQVPSSFHFVEAGKAVFYGVYPNSALGSNVDYAPSLTVTIPTGQTPGNNTFDSAADIMVAKSGEITLTDAFPKDPIELNWTRIVAHADLTFTGLKDEGDETVSKITLTFNDEAKVAGSFYVDVTNGDVTTITGSKNEIVLAGSNLAISEHSIKAWVSLMPVTFTALNVVIETNKAFYSRAISSVSKTFVKNARNKLSINMSSASKIEKTGQLVADGYYVISYGGHMMTVGLEDNAYRGSAVKDVDAPANDAIWKINYVSTEDAYTIFSLETQKELRGVTTSNTNLYIGGSAGTNLFTIEKSSAEATTYKIAPKGNTSRAIGYNTSADPTRFALYTGGTQQPITLDLTSVTVVETPVLTIDNITLANGAAVTTPVAITPSSKVFVNSITVNGVYSDPECTTAASWLNVTYSEEVLAYTATANDTGNGRTAYVSVKGIGTSAETDNVVFSVTQPKLVSYSNKWVLVTSVSELSVNDKVVIVNTDGTKALGKTQNNNNRAAVDVTLDSEDNNIVNINDDVQPLTLGKNGANWTFYTGEGYLCAASSSANYLKTQTENDANGEWSITLNASYEASIVAQGAYTRNELKNNDNIFSCYASGQTAVKIYRFHEDPNSPVVSIDQSELSWESDETDSKIVTVTLNSGAAAGDYTLTPLNGDANEWTITNNNGTFSVAPKAANTNTQSDKSITIRVSHTDDPDVYKDVICKQAKYIDPIQGSDHNATIIFGNNGTKIIKASVTGSDNQGNTWTVTTVGTTSYTPNTSYSQIGSSSKPATSITFTTTLEKDATIKAMSAKFGGFSGTAGTVTLKVGDTTIGTGSLNETNDVTINATTTNASGKVLTVTVTGISKGVKAYEINVIYNN